MAPVDPEGSFRHASQSQSSRLDHLEEELAKLQSGMEKETRGIGGWTKRWGAVLALVVAIIAVPSAVQDAYRAVWSHTHTKLNVDPDAKINYNPYDKRLSFILSFSAVNDGSKEPDDLTGWEAEVWHGPSQEQAFQPVQHHITGPSESYSLESADIHCSSEENSRPEAHIFVFTGNVKRISCTLEGDHLNLFEKGHFKVEFNVRGDQKRYQLEYCFDLTKDDIESIKSGDPHAFRNILCKDGAS